MACGILLCLLTGTAAARKAQCAEMRKELTRLRIEYKRYATGAIPYTGEVQFETIAQMIDEIIELKRILRKSDCDVPSRLEDLGEKPRNTRGADRSTKRGKPKHGRRSNPNSR
jgi:hypothetical protein